MFKFKIMIVFTIGFIFLLSSQLLSAEGASDKTDPKCSVDPASNGLYKITRNVRVLNKKTGVYDFFKASKENPGYVKATNSTPLTWDINVEWLDGIDDLENKITEKSSTEKNSDKLITSCLHFYEDLKGPDETDKEYQKRKEETRPVPFKECKIAADSNGLYVLTRNARVFDPKTKKFGYIHASLEKPVQVKVKNPGSQVRYMSIMKITDLESSDESSEDSSSADEIENSENLVTNCDEFFEDKKNRDETPEQYQKREEQTKPKTYYQYVQLKAEQVSAPQINSLLDPPDACADKTESDLKDLTKAKTPEELQKYVACYRTGGDSGERAYKRYEKNYQSAIGNIASIISPLLEEPTMTEEEKKNAINAWITCSLFKETKFIGGPKPNSAGAVGLGQFTEKGKSGVNQILKDIARYVPGQEIIAEEKLDTAKKVYDSNELKFENMLLDLRIKHKKINEELELSPKDKAKRLQKVKIDKEIKTAENNWRVSERKFKEQVNVEEINVVRYYKRKMQKKLWDDFWAKKGTKPTIALKTGVSSQFLGKNENYELIFLMTSLTLLDNYFEFEKTVQKISEERVDSSEKIPTFMEKQIGSTGMYNRGANGFKKVAMEYYEEQKDQEQWATKFDEILLNLKKNNNRENYNHVLSMKRCMEAGKNQPLCEGETSATMRKCAEEVEELVNRNPCDNPKLYKCVEEKMKVYECTTK